MRIKKFLLNRSERIGMLLMAVVLLLVHVPAAHADAPPTTLKIYEVAGAGGLAGATYRQDTIILFNPTQAAINCTTCAIQTHSGASTTSAWTVYKLPTLAIPAGGYFMISASSPTLSTDGSLSPIPYDYRLKTIEGTTVATDNILSSTMGVVALTNTQTALAASGNPASFCGVGTQLLDLVGYGSNFATNASTNATPTLCYAGSGEAPYDGSTAYGRQLGVIRMNKCIDANEDSTNHNVGDNFLNFVNAPVVYFNSGSNPTPCPTGTQLSAPLPITTSISVAPTNPGVGGSVTFTAIIAAATQPASMGMTAYLDFNSPYYGGSALQMNDGGDNGDGTHTFTLTTIIPAGVVPGFTYPTNITVNDTDGNSFTGSTSVAVTVSVAPPPSAPLTIYEVDGAGGLAGANYRQDTIILFNPTQSTVSCSACAIQTHSGTSNTAAWTMYKLPVLTIPAGGYYMIAASSPTLSSDGDMAPISYDYRLKTIEGTTVDGTSGDNILSSTTGVVAFTSTQVPLTAAAGSVCGTGSQLVDLLGYGSNVATASGTTATPSLCYLGSGEAYYDGSTTFGRQMGATRKNKCTNTSDNANDFINAPVTYFNLSSAPTVCPTSKQQLSAVISATPNNPTVGGQVTLSAAVTGAAQPASSGITAYLDFNSPYYGGTALQMYDDGTNGDAVANDGTYTLATNIPSEVTSGFTYPTNVTINDIEGNSFTGTTPLTIGSAASSSTAGNNNIRIIAWYGAGNLSKSEYARDTIILFNPTQAPITMNNWSLQSGGATGSFTAVTYLLPVATIPAGGFYAIAGSGVDYISSAGCVSNHCNLNYSYDYQLKTIEETAPGATNVLNTDNDLSSTAATIALVDNQTPLGTGCPTTSGHLVDLLGVGASDGSSPVTCYAGTSYATYTPSTLNGVATNINGIVYAYATIRKNKCGNTFNNQNDFMLGFIDFANSATAPQLCPLGNQLSVVSAGSSPNNPGVLDPFTITTSLTTATNPNSTQLSVTADLSNLGLSATSPLYDDGTHGDAVAGDHTYTLATAATAGNVGAVPGLIITATDAQGDIARNLIPLTLAPGVIVMTAPNTAGTVTAGGVLTFPITITGQHGYGGILNITCAGSPNANSLGVPVSTQCVTTPPELTLNFDGSSTVSVAIATGTTVSAGILTGPLLSRLIGGISIVLLTVAVWRRRYLATAVLLILVALLTLNTAACGKNAGLANTTATPGTYTYTVTATDSSLPTITQSVTFTVTVK